MSDTPNTDTFDHLPPFGEMLRDARTLRGRSVEEVAAEVNISPDALREIEQGRRRAPSSHVVKALAEALDLRRDEKSALIEAAELDSPLVRNLLGRPPLAAERRSLTAAILVFLVADIRGYTHYTQEQGDAAAALLTQRFAEMAQKVTEGREGRFIEARGDEILAVFASARQGLEAARDLHQRYTEAYGADPDAPLGIGVGMDVGEAVPVGEGYRGAVINRAARLCSLAGPGETLISTGVVYLAPQVAGVTYISRGQEQLKGFQGLTPILLAAPSHAVAVAAGDQVAEVATASGDRSTDPGE